jgi:Domain of unknown function (DUF1854)
MSQTAFNLGRDSGGRLVFTGADGVAHAGVVVVRAFPVAAPEEGVAVLDADGHELAWFDRLDQLTGREREWVADALAQREFMPEIRRLKSVSSFATPSTWTVETDRGETSFVLKGEEDIRRLAPGVLLVADSHGVQFLIRGLSSMDRHSRKLLDRFL